MFSHYSVFPVAGVKKTAILYCSFSQTEKLTARYWISRRSSSANFRIKFPRAAGSSFLHGESIRKAFRAASTALSISSCIDERTFVRRKTSDFRTNPGAFFHLTNFFTCTRIDHRKSIALHCFVPFIVNEDLCIFVLDIRNLGWKWRHLW